MSKRRKTEPLADGEAGPPLHWLSLGVGVNSTALAVLLCEGAFPHYLPFRCVFADTGEEKDETIAYLGDHLAPYLERHRVRLDVVRGKETPLQRWERLHCTGSRILRVCTDHAKIRPIHALIDAEGKASDVQLLGIAADEPHRAKPSYPGEREKRYPLVEADIDREGCVAVIRKAGLPVPVKSGCWHCPFMRVGEILALAVQRPDRMRRLIALEMAATQAHGPNQKTGGPRTQWNNTPAAEYARRACNRESAGPLFRDIEEDPPCGCYDG